MIDTPVVAQRRLLPAVLGLLSLFLAGCASRLPSDFGAPGDDPWPTARAAVVDAAQRMLGTPYRYGGRSARGFDCSGLASYSYAVAGIDLPRRSYDQFTGAQRVDLKALQPGDLVFFNIDGPAVSHVGIYVGERRFVHAPGSGKAVGVDSLDNPYWRRRIMGAGHYFASDRRAASSPALPR